MPDNATNEIEGKLLIVDDEPHIRSALGRALSLSGYEVDEASSGREAVALLEQYLYDLVILDLQMPGMNGVEVMHRARQLQPELAIVILTGHATLDSAIDAVKLDAVDYLRKPVATDQIVGTVSLILQERAEVLHQQHLIDKAGQALDALRHTAQDRVKPNKIQRFVYVHPLKLDCRRRQVMVEDDPSRDLELTEAETAILSSMMRYKDKVLSCRELATITWGEELNLAQAENLIRPHISRLRRKLVKLLGFSPIQTVRKQGYVFSSPQARQERSSTEEDG